MTDKVIPAELPAAWRAKAAELLRYAPSAAAAWEDAATDLEQALRAAAAESLTLEEASDESGYSAEHLGRMIRNGTIPNAGRERRPRILRKDLPRKGPRLADSRPGPASLTRITRDALATRTHGR